MSDYVDSDLTTQRRHRAERHIAECADCRETLAGLRQIVAALGHLPAPTGGSDPGQAAASVRERLQHPA